MAHNIKVGITHGDINGISYELLFKTFSNPSMLELCTPVVFGSAKLMAYFKKAYPELDMEYTVVKSIDDVKDGRINVVNVSDAEFKVETGKVSEDAGMAAYLSLEAATQALKDHKIDVLVTLPINKKSIQGENFHFCGHTEYLQDRLGDSESEEGQALMILTDHDKSLRVALVTTHLPVSQIPSNITQKGILEKLSCFNKTLQRDYGIQRPTIAVLSLNPHNGDGGLLGKEEEEIIIPAVKEAMENGLLAFGPFPADGFFGSGNYRKYDGILAMYHDQGLAPFKTIAGQGGVNHTAGLPFVRTSPDHGTGYDIAGKGIADPQSFREAIYLAMDIFRNRKRYDDMHRNPLRKQYVERGADKTVDLTVETTEE